MELEDFETIHLAQALAREKGWEHVIEAIRAALRSEYDALMEDDARRSPATTH